MLGFKLLGAGLLVFAGWSLGRRLCAEERRKLEQTRGAVALLQYIRSQIDIFLLPMGDILRFCDLELLKDCGIDTTGLCADNIASRCESLLDPVTRETMTGYFGRAGRGDRAAELERCDGSIKALETRRQVLEGEYSRHCRLIMTLCICAPAGVALLLF